MSDTPWLTIVGLGEDGPDGLSPASRRALEEAEFVTGAARHINLLTDLTGIKAEIHIWPVPYADGIERLLAWRGRRVVMLASGDPFWFGAGTVVARHLAPDEWQAFPAPSSFSLAAARLGWALETTSVTALHAAPFARLRPQLAAGTRHMVTLRDGASVGELATWLAELGFGATMLHVLEGLGGSNERHRTVTAEGFDLGDVGHPVMVALEVAGNGDVIALTSGRPDAHFDNDGQITKRPVRALTLSALAPRIDEHLWDIGGGSGSIAIEWLWAHPTTRAACFEIDADRAARIHANAARLGVDRLRLIEGDALVTFRDADLPDAVFIGGGISDDLLTALWEHLPADVRIVANGVTLEAEQLLTLWQGAKGGDLLRIELAAAAPLGRKRGWKASYPVVQWSVVT